MMPSSEKEFDDWLRKISDRLDTAAAESIEVNAELDRVKQRSVAGSRPRGFARLHPVDQMDRGSVHQTICTVDIAGYGGRDRTRPNYIALRAGMYKSVQQAFAESGIPWEECFQQGLGDGILALAPPTVPKQAFAATLPRVLVAALAAHNDAHPPEERIKLRLSLHAGEVTFDEYGGIASPAVIHASRLLDARPLKEALATASGTLAMIVSDRFYKDVIRHHAECKPETYRRISVDLKETTGVGWIRLPGHEYPAERTSAFVATRAPAVVEEPPALTPLIPMLRPASPQFYEVIEVLENISCMRDEYTRSQVVDELPFAGMIRYFPSRRAHITSILRTCLDFENGVLELTTVISHHEPSGSLPLRQLLTLITSGGR